MLLALFAGTPQAAAEMPVQELLRGGADGSLFAEALGRSGLWQEVDAQAGLLAFVPTDTALRNEGSEFLLTEVLLTEDNAARLRAVLALHIVPMISAEQALGTNWTRLRTLSGECLHISRMGHGALKVGPEAVVTGRRRGSNGIVYLIDRLLWLPEDGKAECHSRSIPTTR